MQYQTPQHEIRKRPVHNPSAHCPQLLAKTPTNGLKWGNVPFRADSLELVFVFRVGLDAQASRQDELTDGGAEAGEEGVEWLW